MEGSYDSYSLGARFFFVVLVVKESFCSYEKNQQKKLSLRQGSHNVFPFNSLICTGLSYRNVAQSREPGLKGLLKAFYTVTSAIPLFYSHLLQHGKSRCCCLALEMLVILISGSGCNRATLCTGTSDIICAMPINISLSNITSFVSIEFWETT